MPRVERAYTAKNVTTTVAVLAAPGALGGLSLRNDSGGSATYTIFDNASAASGTVLATVTLADGASVLSSFQAPVGAVNGLYLSTTGTCVGSVWYYTD